MLFIEVLDLSTKADEHLILVQHMVPYFVTQMGNLKNQQLSRDRKLTKIGNFRPFIVQKIMPTFGHSPILNPILNTKCGTIKSTKNKHSSILGDKISA